MSFLKPPQSVALPGPPPPNRVDERDRFGMPVVPLTLLSETPEQRQARIASIEQLVVDLFQTAVTHLGRGEARSLFESVVKQRWIKGKQPDHERNRQLLELYDRESRRLIRSERFRGAWAYTFIPGIPQKRSRWRGAFAGW
jgi:hypothetical protein